MIQYVKEAIQKDAILVLLTNDPIRKDTIQYIINMIQYIKEAIRKDAVIP